MMTSAMLPSLKTALAFPESRIQKIPRLLVAAADGYLYLYNLDPQEGGECTLMKQHRLDGSAEPASEILDQGSHDRPLVAQTYSAAVTKGVSPCV